jgi:hypothetical protein
MTKLEDAANLSKQGKLNEAIELYKNILKDGKGIKSTILFRIFGQGNLLNFIGTTKELTNYHNSSFHQLLF